MDLQKITNIQIEGIDYNDSPDFVDAFISSAEYDGKEMTEKQLDEVNENSDFVHESVNNFLH